MARIAIAVLFTLLLAGSASRVQAQGMPDPSNGNLTATVPVTDASPAPARTNVFRLGRLDFTALRPWFQFQMFTVPNWRTSNLRAAQVNAARDRRAAGVR